MRGKSASERSSSLRRSLLAFTKDLSVSFMKLCYAGPLPSNRYSNSFIEKNARSVVRGQEGKDARYVERSITQSSAENRKLQSSAKRIYEAFVSICRRVNCETKTSSGGTLTDGQQLTRLVEIWLIYSLKRRDAWTPSTSWGLRKTLAFLSTMTL
ncbi:hypothetical protein M514_05397 [Trichuris suis]|uniref:Uncharacterized protein n=1 Tax=Trichuris suis TaxID=68888 RepID=A0A085M8Z6_9BILA|nr:hypothetical protein M513_05397 [Trichuris suis]KFD72404.1 hypothetical protein M514_05397 [Trichuris suis]